MRDSTDDEIVGTPVRLGDLETMLALDLLGRRNWVRDLDLVTEPLQPPDEVEAAAVPEVGNILLEGEAEDECRAGLAPPIVKLIGDPRAHVVVGLPAREDHLRIVTDLLREVAEVIGVDADAVPADETRFEAEKVPFRARGIEHVPHRHP